MERLLEIINRKDRMSRVAELYEMQRASGSAAIPVQYVEDVGYLLRCGGVMTTVLACCIVVILVMLYLLFTL